MSVDAMFKSINSFYSSFRFMLFILQVKDIGISLVKLEDSLKQLEAVAEVLLQIQKTVENI